MILNNSLKYISAIAFGMAILHTFLAPVFHSKAQNLKSMGKKGVWVWILSIIGELELVFMIWALVIFCLAVFIQGPTHALNWVMQTSFDEPLFVGVILILSSTQPILLLAEKGIEFFVLLMKRILNIHTSHAFYLIALTLGAWLGSLVTEPAAMTVVAILLLERFLKHSRNMNFKYATLGLLFVNISIGGVLTSFAAPPVLMVAKKWNWDSVFMISHFGWKALLASTFSTLFVVYKFKHEIKASFQEDSKASLNSELDRAKMNFLSLVHVLLMTMAVVWMHEPLKLLIIVLLLLILTKSTRSYQSPLKYKEAILVCTFLAGLVLLGQLQTWWLEPILTSLGHSTLYLGAAFLTAFTDNAALTFLGSQVPLTDASKYFLVAGAVVGGGTTVIANAPNPIGASLLQQAFGEGIKPFRLALAALIPTVIALTIFWL